MGLSLVRDGTDRPITTPEFIAIVRSDRVGRRTEAVFRQYFGERLRLPPMQHLLGVAQDGIEAGVCHPLPLEGEGPAARLVVSADFPRYVAEHNEATSQEAALFCGVYVRAFDIVSSAIKSRGLGNIPNFGSSWRAEYWDHAYGSPGIGVAYRAAGSIALASSSEIHDFDTAAPPPYPPHIAGLMNPAPTIMDGRATQTIRNLEPFVRHFVRMVETP